MKNDFLVLDIETIPDPDVPAPAEADPEKMLAVPHHKIACIGALLFDGDYHVKSIGIMSEAKDERGFVSDFVSFVQTKQPTLVTFNGRGFDLPVIAMRCLRYGIQFPYYYNSRDVRYRYTADGHLDLMDFLSDFGGTRAARLDALAKLCGMPGKVGIDGKDVARMVSADRLPEVRNYCLCDVAQTAAVFLRAQLIRGVISRGEYQVATGELIAKIQADVRLKPVASAMNIGRLLVNE